jgi:SAM-dependent methyltransferase
MTVTESSRSRRHGSPHLSGGDHYAKVAYELESVKTFDDFWVTVSGCIPSNILDNRDVLDVGCGWGGKALHYLSTTSLRSITGLDLPGVFDPGVPANVAAEIGLTNCRFVTGHAESLPFIDRQFDIVLSDDVLEHVSDPERALMECWRVLRSPGIVIARFPSIRMLFAHHFDRALSLPGLHYLMPMETWAAGFNGYLVSREDRTFFEPFSEVRRTKFHEGVTCDLNGIDQKQFVAIANTSPFKVRALEMSTYRVSNRFGRHADRAYRALRRIPALREPLSRSLIFVGEKE